MNVKKIILLCIKVLGITFLCGEATIISQFKFIYKLYLYPQTETRPSEF